MSRNKSKEKEKEKAKEMVVPDYPVWDKPSLEEIARIRVIEDSDTIGRCVMSRLPLPGRTDALLNRVVLAATYVIAAEVTFFKDNTILVLGEVSDRIDDVVELTAVKIDDAMVPYSIELHPSVGGGWKIAAFRSDPPFSYIILWRGRRVG